MPCGDTQCGDWERMENGELCKEIKHLTQVACELATAIGGSKYGGVVFDALNASTQQWVREHEEMDRRGTEYIEKGLGIKKRK